ncbi:MAG TPA: DMT family transporter, partial [Anaerolineales bacterium]|nr:DMT family transporter [Anaerolineales bacterium]
IYGSKLGQWRSVPWYTFGTGLFGVMVIASISYMIPRLGVATATTIVIAGQLLAGVVLDHYGLLGVTTKSLDAARVVGLAIVTVGVWLTVR